MKMLPIGNSTAAETVVRCAADVGKAVRQHRLQQQLTQLDLAGLGNSGNRFVIELERGKPTLQLTKVLQILDLLGLELVIRKRGRADVP